MDIQFLKDIPFFQHLSEKDFHVLLNFVERKMFKQGDEIITQGDEGDGLYVVFFGDVDVLVSGTKVATLGPKNFFGEIALITNEPRTATVVAVSKDVSTLFLSRFSFESIKDKIDPEIRKEVLKRIQANFALKN